LKNFVVWTSDWQWARRENRSGNGGKPKLFVLFGQSAVECSQTGGKKVENNFVLPNLLIVVDCPRI